MTGQRWRAPDGSRDSCLPPLHAVPCAYSWDDSFPYFPCAGHASKMTDYLKTRLAVYDGRPFPARAGPMQALEAANPIRRNAGNPPAYEIRLAASRSGRLQTDVGVPVEATSWQDDAADNPHLI